MYLQNLAVSLMQPSEDDDLVAYCYTIQGLRSECTHVKPCIRSTFRTLLGRLPALLEFRADHADRAQLKGILFPVFFSFAPYSCCACKPTLHRGRVYQARLLELKLTSWEHCEIGNAADVVLCGKLWEPFRIHLEDDCAPGKVPRGLRHVRRCHPARPAPGRPEIY